MPIHPSKRPSVLTGIALMVLSMFCSASMNTAIRALAQEMPAPQMVFLRNIASLCMIVLWVLARRDGKHVLHTKRPAAHFWRASIGFVAMELWFYGLTLMPLNLATALSFTTPIFATILAMLILKEQAGWRRWLAVAAGFVGVLVIIRPGTTMLGYSAGIVLFTSLLMALSGTVVKTLTRTEAPETIVLFMTLYMTPLSAPLGLYHWQAVSLRELGLVSLIAGFSTAMHLMLTRAYRHADMVVLLPFDFTRLVFTAALAYAFFGETLDGPTVTGALIIMGSSLYIVHREALMHRKRQGLLLEAGEL